MTLKRFSVALFVALMALTLADRASAKSVNLTFEYQNQDGSIVTVMYNSGAATTYTVAVGGKTYQFSMPGNGWATLVYVPSS